VSQPDSRPLLIRIAKLVDRLKERSASTSRFAFFNDPSKVIFVAAFIISIVTTVYSWRKDNLETQLANRRQLDATMQQLVDVGIKNYEFTTKNKSDPNIGAMAGSFTARTGFMANKAAQVLRDLRNGTAIDYIMVGNALSSAGEYSKASLTFRQAIQAARLRNAENTSALRVVTEKIRTNPIWIGFSRF
jgi:hypothetical protein